MVLDPILEEIDAVEQRLAALRSAIKATGPSFMVPGDAREAAPLRARAAAAASSLRGLADSLAAVGLTEGRGRL